MKASAAQIAKRYVIALLDITEKSDVRTKVEQDLKQLHAIYNESEMFRGLIANPLLTRPELAKSMQAILTALSADKVTQQFIALLAARKRLEILPEIINGFLTAAASARGEVKAELISAVPLKDKDAANVAERLGKAVGKKILLETRQDPELLGGVIVKVGSTQLDSSLSGKMRRLSNKLKAA